MSIKDYIDINTIDYYIKNKKYHITAFSLNLFLIDLFNKSVNLIELYVANNNYKSTEHIEKGISDNRYLSKINKTCFIDDYVNECNNCQMELFYNKDHPIHEYSIYDNVLQKNIICEICDTCYKKINKNSEFTINYEKYEYPPEIDLKLMVDCDRDCSQYVKSVYQISNTNKKFTFHYLSSCCMDQDRIQYLNDINHIIDIVEKCITYDDNNDMTYDKLYSICQLTNKELLDII